MELKRQIPKFPLVMFSLILMIGFGICYLIYEEFKYNITPLTCSPPSFFFKSSSFVDKKAKAGGAIETYVDTCTQYYPKDKIFKWESDLRDALNGHWYALNKTYSQGSKNIEEIAGSLYNVKQAGLFFKPVTESLWIATIDMQNSCQPHKDTDVKKCASLISTMIDTTTIDTPAERKKYQEKFINIENNFSKESDFLSRLEKILNHSGRKSSVSLDQANCGPMMKGDVKNRSYYYLPAQGGDKLKQCADGEASDKAVLDNEDGSYSPRLRTLSVGGIK